MLSVAEIEGQFLELPVVARLLYPKVQFYGLVGLDAQGQKIGLRDFGFLKIDLYFGQALIQLLTGGQRYGNALPSFVGRFDGYRYESIGRRFRIFYLLAVALVLGADGLGRISRD